MARTYRDDLRKQAAGSPWVWEVRVRELADRFGVSVQWAWKVSAAQRATGSSARTPQRRASSRIDGEQVRRLIQGRPDILLRELVAELGRAGQPISLRTWRGW